MTILLVLEGYVIPLARLQWRKLVVDLSNDLLCVPADGVGGEYSLACVATCRREEILLSHVSKAEIDARATLHHGYNQPCQP